MKYRQIPFVGGPKSGQTLYVDIDRMTVRINRGDVYGQCTHTDVYIIKDGVAVYLGLGEGSKERAPNGERKKRERKRYRYQTANSAWNTKNM